MAASAASQRSPRKWEKAISHMLHPTLTQPAARKTGLTPPCSPNDTKFISRQQMSKAENVPQSTSLSTKKIHRLTVPWLSHGASSSNPPPSKDIWSISAFLNPQMGPSSCRKTRSGLPQILHYARGKIVFHETCPWCQKDRGPLMYSIVVIGLWS
ncbi:uncharacterized protein LOC144581936 isoform X4 [Callithrix jacchus]